MTGAACMFNLCLRKKNEKYLPYLRHVAKKTTTIMSQVRPTAAAPAGTGWDGRSKVCQQCMRIQQQRTARVDWRWTTTAVAEAVGWPRARITIQQLQNHGWKGVWRISL